MREDKTLLLEKETKTAVKTKEDTKKELAKKEKRQIENLFSSKPDEEKIIEKPNFDEIEELPPEKKKTVLKLKKESEKSSYKVNKKLKFAIVCLSICLLFAFTIATGVEIMKQSARLDELQSSYDASLSSLLYKINSTETGNRALDLFETFPEADLGADSISPSSNWFDRFCNFLSGLFGG